MPSTNPYFAKSLHFRSSLLRRKQLRSIESEFLDVRCPEGSADEFDHEAVNRKLDVSNLIMSFGPSSTRRETLNLYVEI